MSNIKNKIDVELRRPNAGKDALCNVVADVAQAIADNGGGGGITTIPFEPRILFSDLTSSKDLVKGKTPIAIEVVPGSHMEDGKSRWMSLKNMSLTDPENGTIMAGDDPESNPGAGIMWGNNESLIGDTEWNQIPAITDGIGNDGNSSGSIGLTTEFTEEPYGTVSNGYLPFYGAGMGVNYPDAPDYKYTHYTAAAIPCPFNADGTANPAYRATEVNGESINNPLSRFDGKEMTDLIIAAATETETEGAITNSSDAGHYPAAMCCHRYVTEGTNAGDWYLPAAGELGYAIVNTLVINDAINDIIEAGFDAIGMPENTPEANDQGLGSYLWSSSEYSSSNAYGVYCSGGVYYDVKDNGNSSLRVRAFLAL